MFPNYFRNVKISNSTNSTNGLQALHDFISDSRLSEGADSKHETIKHAFNNTEIERERRKREQEAEERKRSEERQHIQR